MSLETTNKYEFKYVKSYERHTILYTITSVKAMETEDNS